MTGPRPPHRPAEAIRRRIVLAGYGAAAAAGAITVGLIAGVTHTAEAAAQTKTTTVPTSGTDAPSTVGPAAPSASTDTPVLSQPQPGNGPQGGSHGS